MSRRSALALSLVALSALGGCNEKNPAGAASATATATTSAPAPKPKPTEKPPEPEALKVDQLKKDLSCAADAKEGPCGVLNAFTDCVAWTGQTEGGDGRWIGIGYDRAGGKTTEEVTLVRSLRVPLDQVGPGQLGAKLSVSRIPDDEPVLLKEGKRAAKALFRGDVPKPQNPAMKYVNNRKDWSEAFAYQAKENQVFAQGGGGTYFCNLKDQRLILVKLSNAREKKGDGLYAQLRPTKW
jgi:hypothetical protein